MTPSLALRPATHDDVAFAFALYRDLMFDLTEQLLPWNEVAQHRVVRDGIAAGRVEIVVLDGADIGWIQVNNDGGVIELGQIYVGRAHQGKGVGTELVRQVIERAAGGPVRLSVMKNNPRAHALYERLGFVVRSEDRFKRHLERPGARPG